MSSPTPVPSADESLYAIGEEEKEFFKHATRINNDEELRKHICEVQARAYSTFPYPCVRAFMFLNFQLRHSPVYEDILKLGKERPDAIFLEIGCAFGTDFRKLIADGYPLENVLTLDIQKEYYDLGHQLFKTTPETYPVAFMLGDVFNLASELPQAKPNTEPLPPLRSLTSLTPLRNRVSVIYASLVFNLFPPEKQQRLAHILANLLSPSSGSVIVGRQLATESGINEWNSGKSPVSVWRYSIPAWKDLWTGSNGPFKLEEVDTQVSQITLPPDVSEAALGQAYPPIVFLDWSIKRL